jgi:hypothetical protein
VFTFEKQNLPHCGASFNAHAPFWLLTELEYPQNAQTAVYLCLAYFLLQYC